MKILKFAAASVLSFAFLSTSLLAARPAKLPVCHFDEEENLFILKNLNPKAATAHLRHGDILAPLDGETASVTLADGTIVTLDSTCTEVAGDEVAVEI